MQASSHRKPRSVAGINSAVTIKPKSSSGRLLILVLVGLALVSGAYWARNSRWTRDSLYRGKDLPELEQLVRARPSDSIAQYYLGKSLYIARRFPEAEAAYSESVRLDPDYARAHLGLALTLYDIGEYGR